MYGHFSNLLNSTAYWHCSRGPKLDWDIIVDTRRGDINHDHSGKGLAAEVPRT